MKSNSIPMRRCVGCMTSKPKDELNRYTLVDGLYKEDPLKVAPGRGIYLCKEQEKCRSRASKRYKFEEKI